MKTRDPRDPRVIMIDPSHRRGGGWSLGQQAAVTEIHECTDECSARPCKYARRNLTLDAEKGGERRLEGVVETWA